MIQEILEKNQYQKVIDYYLDNMANKDYYTQGVLIKYSNRLAAQLYFVIEINQKYLNKNKENIKKIICKIKENSVKYVYKAIS